MKTYKGLTLKDSGEIKISRFIAKKPSPGEVLIKPLFAGLCGTDIQILRRMRKDPATILGHEGIGEVIAVGDSISKFKRGQKVVFNPVNPKNQHIILGHTIPGIFQEKYLIHEEELDYGLIVPAIPTIPDICGSLVEPLGTIVYGQFLVNKVKKPKTIVIVGGGPIGLLHAILAKLDKKTKVFLIHNDKKRIQWILEKGILLENEIILDSPVVVKSIYNKTKGKGVEAVYLCTNRPGALSSLNKALQYVSHEGVINMVGGIQDGDEVQELPDLELNQIRRANVCGFPKEGKVFEYQTVSGKTVYLTGHRGTSTIHLLKSSKLLATYPEQFMQVVTHIVSLDSAKKLFDQLIASRSHQVYGEEFVKAIIDMNSKSLDVEKFFIDRYL